MAINLKALLDARQANLDEAKALVDKAEAENRDLTADEEKRYGDLLAKAKELEELRRPRQDLEPAQPPAAPAAPAVPAAPARPEGRFQAPAIQIAGEHREYRLLRAINQMATQHRLDGFEAEVSTELAKRHGKSPQGFYMPYNFFDPLGEGCRLPTEAIAYRASLLASEGGLTTTTGVGAKPTIWDAQQFIEILRHRLITRRLVHGS